MDTTTDVNGGKRKTAFLVIHGVGQHDKYETLAGFAAGLMLSLQVNSEPRRILVPFDDGVESALTLQWQGQQVDIFEYYYQPYLQRAVRGSDVIGFLFRTINSVKDLYGKYEFDSGASTAVGNSGGERRRADQDLIVWHYLINRPTTLPSKLVSWTVRGLYALWNGMPAPLQKPFEWLASFFIERYVIEVIGDLVAYLAIDPKSRLNEKRHEILSACERRIKELLAKTGEAGYDQVIVAGHSLGSVVGYDALSRIARDTSCGRFDLAHSGKLAGFLTFGSPLDKVAYVFWPTSSGNGQGGGNAWERLKENLYAGLLPHFYGIRCSSALELKSTVEQPQSTVFEHLKWVNYYSDRDLIAGHLDAYDGVVNRRIGIPDDEVDVLQAFSDHSVYWGSREMFDGVVVDFLGGVAQPRSTSAVRLPPHPGDTPHINRFFAAKSRPLVLGHRGVPLLHQENTLAGLRKAVELGIDGVEFDVFKTRDDRIVVFHDEETERLTGVKGRITEMSWDEVSRLRIQKRIDMGGGRIITYPTEQRIPLLEEVLDEFNGKLLMNIEMKAYAPQWVRRHTGSEVAKTIYRCGAADSVIVTSFDFFMLFYLERELPGLHSGFAYDDGMVDNAIGEWFRRVPEIATDLAKAPGNQNDISFLNFVLEANAVGAAIGSTLVDVEHTLIDVDTVDKFKAKNMLVGAYTLYPLDTRYVRDAGEDQAAVLQRLIERRVDWLETDDPVKVMEIYAGMGW